MRKVVLVFIVFLLAGFRPGGTSITKWVITKGCSLKVDGKTNVNSFSCAITGYDTPDTILVARQSNMPLKLKGQISLSVQNFDCHNSIMTSDLRKTLKSKEFPRLTIRFLTLGRYPDENSRDALTKGWVVIELAGVSKQVEVNYRVVSADRTQINLMGTQKIHFSDFNIKPPSKIGGMIKTQNELQVVFDLRVKVLG
ncbi:MAG: YceI family protein [Flavisolibacter sp.]